MNANDICNTVPDKPLIPMLSKRIRKTTNIPPGMFVYI